MYEGKCLLIYAYLCDLFLRSLIGHSVKGLQRVMLLLYIWKTAQSLCLHGLA